MTSSIPRTIFGQPKEKPLRINFQVRRTPEQVWPFILRWVGEVKPSLSELLRGEARLLPSQYNELKLGFCKRQIKDLVKGNLPWILEILKRRTQITAIRLVMVKPKLELQVVPTPEGGAL